MEARPPLENLRTLASRAEWISRSLAPADATTGRRMAEAFAARARQPLDREAPLTLGLEIEFFLASASGLCTPDEAMAFFDALVTRGWKAESGHASHRQVSFEGSVLHFEFFPHLLEISSAVFSSLGDLENHLKRLLADIHQAAAFTRLELHTQVPAYAHRVNPLPDSHRGDTDDSRRAWTAHYFGDSTRNLVDFPAFTASVHFHVGGLPWWDQPEIIERLYAWEAQYFLESWEAVLGKDAFSSYLERVFLYRTCFPGLALIGIPDMDSWDYTSWGSALLRGAGPLKAADSVDGLRDYQLVRPRLSGTIEFRGEAPTLDLNVLLPAAARRLAASVLARNATQSVPKLRDSFAKWQHALDNRLTSFPESARLELIQALRSRGIGEEKWLSE
ncbi:hypothetical protein K2X33_12645 [bacterium]|nr:hypothetical protein [bacterium]